MATRSPQHSSSKSLHNSLRRGWRLAAYGAVATATVGALAVTATSAAFAAPGDVSADTTSANVDVSSAITLSALTPTFTLTGAPDATVEGLAAVTMTVTTNNLLGYSVTVQATTAAMAGGDTGNPDSIPVGALSVRETGTTGYTPLSSTAAVTVHTQAARSEEVGDDLSNDYKVVIPFVNEDTYTATLDYVATTL